MDDQTTAGATGTAPETSISKEVFFVVAGLSTQDPSNIFSTVEKAKKKGIAIDIVHLAADVYICRYLAERTGGRFVSVLFP
jgi:transcription initiation factor TFIIH subunit 2